MEYVVALVDCNNFYVSCERAFNPRLYKRPVVVLSNNDGLVIARSNEAKALGFEMGDFPYIKREVIKQNNIAVLSSNYPIYFDMCDRVREVLSLFTPRLEKYSIDECFLDLSGIPHGELAGYGRRIKEMVERCTEIPVSVGIASTKVLAKVANKIAKKSAKAQGVLNLFQSPYLERALAQTDVGNIWFVGPAYERMLKENGINNALELRDAPEHWVRKKMTVVGARIQSELKGVSCLPLELVPPAKKMVGTAQGFGVLIESLEELKEAAATRASQEALKLRQEKQCVKELTVWINTNPFGHDPQYGDARTVVFPVATNDTSTLIRYVVAVVESLYKRGYRYKRIGLNADKLEPEDAVQGHLFLRPEDARRPALMRVIDQLNGVKGDGTIRMASVGINQRWLTRFERQSPHYTTRLRDLPIARVP
jgi:DNA polymerase V